VPPSTALVGPRLPNDRPAGDAGRITESGRETKERVEALTDDLAAPAHDLLTPGELDRLIADLEPLAAAFDAAGWE
jgi:hypothetical protein